MKGNLISSFVFIVGFANFISSQQVRPLPNPIINIQCGQTSLLRATGLISPNLNQQLPATCTYRIHALSFQICQMRLEFRTFSMAPPTVDQSAPFQKCNGDSLQVGNITLCGENSGQHIYIPINPRQGERQLAITINTRNGNGNGNGMARSNWNIAVHQLECPFGQSRSLNVAEAPEVVGPSRNPRAFVSEWLAPAGCLQYFVHPTGTLESFNFNNGIGPYIGDMNYAICFRRQRGHNMLKLLPTFFRLNSGNPANAGLNEDCFDQIQTQLRSEDYLFIPNAELSDVPPTRARLFCGQSPISKIITSTPPGPFMMTFNADRVYSPTEEIGFRMQYEIL